MEDNNARDDETIAGRHDDDIVFPISILRDGGPTSVSDGLESDPPIIVSERALGPDDPIDFPDDPITMVPPDDSIIIPRPSEAAGSPGVVGVGAEFIEGSDDWARFRIEIGDLRRWAGDDVAFALPVERGENALRLGDGDERDDPIIIPHPQRRPLDEDERRLAGASAGPIQNDGEWARFDIDIEALERMAGPRDDVTVRLELADE